MKNKILTLLIVSIIFISACTIPETNLNEVTVKEELGCGGEASYFDGYLGFYNDTLKITEKYNILVCSGNGKVVFSKQNDNSGTFYHFVTEQVEHWTNYKLEKIEGGIFLE